MNFIIFPIRFLSTSFVLIHTFCVCYFIFNLFLRVKIFLLIGLFLTVPGHFVLFSYFLSALWGNTQPSSPCSHKGSLLGRTGSCLSWNQRTFTLASFSSDSRKITQLLVLYMTSTQIHYLSKNLYSPLCGNSNSILCTYYARDIYAHFILNSVYLLQVYSNILLVESCCLARDTIPWF